MINSLKIKLLRKELKLTQEEMAGMLGVSKRNVENWEQGLNKPNNKIKIVLEFLENNFKKLGNKKTIK